MSNQSKSSYLFKKLCEVIPGGVNSPVRACKGLLDAPMIAEKGVGDLIYSADGEAYIDYCGSWGSLIHGHAHPEILKKVIERIEKGTSFGVTTEIEGKLAHKMTEMMSMDKIRFVSSGTEATMSAIRVARGYTKRPYIIKFNGNYHGHADFFLVNAGSGLFNLNASSSSEGIPDEIVKYTISLPYNNIELVKEALEQYKDQIAAIILEPIAANMGLIPASQEFIEQLRKETIDHGIVLIFDEVISGFRATKTGAQGYYGIKPDLSCFGKIIGGGFPAAAFGGCKEIMDCLAPLGKVYQAGTLSGNPVAMEAGLQALTLLDTPNFYDELKNKTQVITKPVKEYILEKNLDVCLHQVGSMFTLFFGTKEIKDNEDLKRLDTQMFAKFFKHMYDEKIYIPPSQFEAWFVSNAHKKEHLLKTKEAILTFLNNT